jgi:hypothetical protein
MVPDYRQWVRDSAEVIAYDGTSPRAEKERGRVIAYMDRPTLLIQSEDGSTFQWIADLCELAPDIDAIRAAAWDEGYERGLVDLGADERTPSFGRGPQTVNPYRREDKS